VSHASPHMCRLTAFKVDARRLLPASDQPRTWMRLRCGWVGSTRTKPAVCASRAANLGHALWALGDRGSGRRC
jgi:hypothetical protein